MRNSVPITFLAGLAAFAFGAHLLLGWNAPPVVEALAALLHRQADTYDQSVVLYQRLPRALIAIYVGSMAAVTGYVLQGIARNPLASPSTLGINAGATLAVVSAAFLFDADLRIQGFAALCGAAAGFLACVAVARFAGGRNDPRGLSLILSGALLSMLLVGMTNALLLSDPARRADMLRLADAFQANPEAIVAGMAAGYQIDTSATVMNANCVSAILRGSPAASRACARERTVRTSGNALAGSPQPLPRRVAELALKCMSV